jgi:hypothetical protein
MCSQSPSSPIKQFLVEEIVVWSFLPVLLFKVLQVNKQTCHYVLRTIPGTSIQNFLLDAELYILSPEFKKAKQKNQEEKGHR